MQIHFINPEINNEYLEKIQQETKEFPFLSCIIAKKWIKTEYFAFFIENKIHTFKRF